MMRSGIVGLLLLLAHGTVLPQYRVVGYYPMWSKGSLPASSVKFNYLTHICHAFAWPNADGSISTSDGAVVDTAIVNAAHRAGRKILLSFGGAAESQWFPSVAADSVLRYTFIQNVVAHLEAYGYDGADMDWEGPSSVAERTNEVTLLRDLRTAFQQSHPEWLITMAVGPTNWSGQWHDFPSLSASVDWFGAMAYDFHGSWSATSGHNAPLYPGDHDGSVDEGITYMMQTRGIAGSQLVLGMPFYGKRFQSAGLYTAQTGTTDLLYATVINDQNHNWAYTWDNVSQVPYLVAPSHTQLDVFDDSLSLSMKCDYAKGRGLSGIMIWALGQDLIGSAQPLMEAVGIAMNSTLSVPIATISPMQYVLHEAYPNPFNPSTVIRYDLPARAQVTLAVFNVLGQAVSTLADEMQEAGSHEVHFDASGLSSGVYLCRLQAGGFIQTTKLMLLR